MDSQTPNDYKEYFLNKFIKIFQNFVNECIDKINTDNDTIKNDLLKIQNVFTKLNYVKIIEKMCQNTKLQEGMAFIVKNNFNNDIMMRVFTATDNKIWALMPSLYINKIFVNLSIENRKPIYDILHSLYVCAVTYNKVVQSISSTDGNTEFNPFKGVGEVAENMDITTMFNGVEVKSSLPDVLETLINNFLENDMDGKIKSYMDTSNDDDVNIATEKLTDVLNSDNFKGNKQSTKILGSMLNNIKNEVLNLKNTPRSQLNGKKGIEKLTGIAQTVAGNMMTSFRDNNVNVTDLWDATSNLARTAIDSNMFDYVDKMIRSNLIDVVKNAPVPNN